MHSWNPGIAPNLIGLKGATHLLCPQSDSYVRCHLTVQGPHPYLVQSQLILPTEQLLYQLYS